MSPWRTFSNEALIAFVLAILACVIVFPARPTPEEMAAGVCSFFDYGAFGFGLAAVLAGIAAIINGARGNDLYSLVLGGLALLVGAIRVAYGSGYAFGPCG